MRVKGLQKITTGFSLLELMIAMALGLIVIGGTVSMYISTIRGSADTVNSARLNYDLETVMQVMVGDIRRAGYWGGAVVDSVATDNPFTGNLAAVDANIIISNLAGEDADSCVLYTYDADASGVNTSSINLPALNTDDVADDEFYGFRLREGGIDMRLTTDDIAVSTCSNDDGNWAPIIDTNKVNVTSLTFTTNYKCLVVSKGKPYNTTCADVFIAGDLVAGDKAVETRQIDIELEGEVQGDNAVSKSLSGIVKVRNDRIFIQ